VRQHLLFVKRLARYIWGRDRADLLGDGSGSGGRLRQ
jgi:hypothetical protein